MNSPLVESSSHSDQEPTPPQSKKDRQNQFIQLTEVLNQSQEMAQKEAERIKNLMMAEKEKEQLRLQKL